MPAHRTCSAASHAAQILLDNFFVTIKPAHELPYGTPSNLTASEHHIGVLIDLNTNAFEVAKIREPLRHWQEVMGHGVNDPRTAAQILYYVRCVIEALRKVPRYLNDADVETVMSKMPPMVAGSMPRLKLTRAAVDATTQLLHVYNIVSKNSRASRDARIIRLEIARLLDTCLGLNKVLPALPMMERCEAGLRRGDLTPDQVIAYLRELGVRLTYLPHFRDRQDEVKLLA